MEQTCILILGMHRSGTSALTGVLYHLGVYLGKQLSPPNKYNAKGYFENIKIFDINERILRNINSRWDDMFFKPKKVSKVNKALLNELKDIIAEEFKYITNFAIKDPRICYLFPLYEKVLNDLKINIKIIIPYRNPLEVAKSLEKRNRFSIEKGLLLWIKHVLLAEKFSRNYERKFIPFDSLLTHPEKFIDMLVEKGFVRNDKYRKQFETIFNEFLDEKLKSHNININSMDGILKIVVDIFDSLKSNDFKKISELSEYFWKFDDLFYSKEVVKFIDNVRENICK